jgi:hypothetical protein
VRLHRAQAAAAAPRAGAECFVVLKNKTEKQKMKTKSWFQQGDVIIEPLSARGLKFPTDGKPMTQKDGRGYLLALGEVKPWKASRSSRRRSACS